MNREAAQRHGARCSRRWVTAEPARADRLPAHRSWPVSAGSSPSSFGVRPRSAARCLSMRARSTRTPVRRQSPGERTSTAGNASIRAHLGSDCRVRTTPHGPDHDGDEELRQNPGACRCIETQAAPQLDVAPSADRTGRTSSDKRTVTRNPTAATEAPPPVVSPTANRPDLVGI